MTPETGPASAADSGSGQPVIVIEARPDSAMANLRALWRYRGFYGFLFKEVLMRRARGTLLGFWWLILRPVLTAGGLLFAFMAVAPVETGQDIPYPVFFLSGYIPWRLFQGTVTMLPRSLSWARGIMQRTYFPRILVPLAGFGPVLIEVLALTVVFVVVVATAAWNGQPAAVSLSWSTLWLLPALMGALMFALGIGMVLGIVALFFRDVLYSIGFMVQILMLATPVVYPATFVSEQYRWVVYVLNPMAQVVIVSRWALTGQGAFEPFFVALSFATILLVLAACVAFFLRAEVHLGDQL
jgi:lipopolysaccharide transport system permease protein